jgi:hypothetical protein
MLTMRFAYAILLTGVLGFNVGLTSTGPRRPRESVTLARAVAHQGKSVSNTAIRPTPSCNLGSDEMIAWCEFKSLTNATTTWPMLPLDPSGILPGSRPIWTEWKDKCDLRLGPCASHRLGEGISKGPIEVLSLSLPSQFVPHVKRNPKLAGIIFDLRQGHELASVLFSPEMEQEATRLNSISNLNGELDAADQQLKTGAAREIDPSKLLQNSTVVKLIWEVVFNKDPRFPAHVYQPPSLPPSKLQNPLFWKTNYLVDGDETIACPARLPLPGFEAKAPIVPVNCFYHYTVDASDENIRGQMSQDGRDMITPHVPPVTKAMVLLVGAHIMVFNQAHPLWQWMTFYWTTMDNGQGWGSPWRHYQMMTTSADHEGGSLSHPSIANPYLEGYLDSMQTNCVSCHSLAAYSKAGGKVAHATDIVDKTAPPEYPATEMIAVKQNYFDHSIRSHFLWSIADINLVPSTIAGPNKSIRPGKPAANKR